MMTSVIGRISAASTVSFRFENSATTSWRVRIMKSRPLRPTVTTCTGASASLEHEAAGAAQDVRVQRSGQPLVRGDQQDCDLLDLAMREQRERRRALRIEMQRRKVADHRLEPLGVGAAGQHTLLRAAHLRSGDHLHGARDLGNVADRTNSAPNFSCTGQRVLLAGSRCYDGRRPARF